MNQKAYNAITWGMVIVSLALAFIAWGSNLSWSFSGLTSYQIFPLLGLFAWMTMATHYYSGAIREKYASLTKPKFYAVATGYFVLACILLHPGILAYNEWANTSVLPPESFVNYVGESLKLAAMLGSISLMIFLSYEIFDRMRNNAKIKKYWWAVSISQSLAMILIFVHALRLGGEMNGWFLFVWWFYGLALIPCFYMFHKTDVQNMRK